MSDCLQVGKKLVSLCKAGKNLDAINTLYDPGIVSIEAMAMSGHPQRQEGIAAVKAKGEWWESSHTVHSASAEGPYPHGDRFIVHFKYDVTPTQGPYSGQRMQLDETALYTVKNGKIVQEEFFYSMENETK